MRKVCVFNSLVNALGIKKEKWKMYPMGTNYKGENALLWYDTIRVPFASGAWQPAYGSQPLLASGAWQPASTCQRSMAASLYLSAEHGNQPLLVSGAWQPASTCQRSMAASLYISPEHNCFQAVMSWVMLHFRTRRHLPSLKNPGPRLNWKLHETER